MKKIIFATLGLVLAVIVSGTHVYAWRRQTVSTANSEKSNAVSNAVQTAGSLASCNLRASPAGYHYVQIIGPNPCAAALERDNTATITGPTYNTPAYPNIITPGYDNNNNYPAYQTRQSAACQRPPPPAGYTYVPIPDSVDPCAMNLKLIDSLTQAPAAGTNASSQPAYIYPSGNALAAPPSSGSAYYTYPASSGCRIYP